jgi:glyoxylase-like metal-dependent hydrolase (beta-lactamase superfamily II)
LGSGSSGNALLLEAEDGLFLVDCGLLWRDLKARAERAGFSLRGLRYVFITHEHTDHVRGLDSLVRRGVKVLASSRNPSSPPDKGHPRGTGSRTFRPQAFPHPPFP